MSSYIRPPPLHLVEACGFLKPFHLFILLCHPGLFILYALFALYFILPVVFFGFYIWIISESQVASEDGILCRGMEGFLRGQWGRGTRWKNINLSALSRIF